MNATELSITRKTSDCAIGFASGVAIAFWRYHTKAADVLELQKAASQAYEASRRPIALFQIVPGSALAPDSHARAALARTLASLNGRVAHSAIVHEGEGFRAAMIRSIVTGVVALSNPGFPHQVFSSLAESIAWMTRAEARFDGSKITSAVAKVRAAVPIEVENSQRTL